MEMKQCYKCKKTKPVSDFYVHKSGLNEGHFYCYCKYCQMQCRREHRKKTPWYTSYEHAKERCNNPKNHKYPRYGGRGIKFLLTLADVKYLWERDSGDKLIRSSIDRINPDGHYELSNCRFIENSENARLSAQRLWKQHSSCAYLKRPIQVI